MASWQIGQSHPGSMNGTPHTHTKKAARKASSRSSPNCWLMSFIQNLSYAPMALLPWPSANLAPEPANWRDAPPITPFGSSCFGAIVQTRVYGAAALKGARRLR